MNPTRDTGAWLPQVESCPYRCEPCGNAECVDEAMHGAWTNSKWQRIEAFKRAAGRALQCEREGHFCPLMEYMQADSPKEAVNNFIESIS